MGSRNHGRGSLKAGIICPMARYRSGTAAAAATMNFVHITRISRSLRCASWSTVSEASISRGVYPASVIVFLMADKRTFSGS